MECLDYLNKIEVKKQVIIVTIFITLKGLYRK